MRGAEGFPLRLCFTKRGPVRFISHRDLARAFERALRRVQLPLAFTQGFSPRPKISFGLALSVGHESDAEYLDVELTHDPGCLGLPAALSAALPDGIVVTGAAALADRAPALQEGVTAVDYRLDASNDARRPDPAAVAAAVSVAMARPVLEIPRVRKGRQVIDDVRPAIRHIDLLGSDVASVTLGLELATQPRSARPGEVIAALNTVADGERVALIERRVIRTRQWIERGGARLEPLEADPRVRVPEVRAS